MLVLQIHVNNCMPVILQDFVISEIIHKPRDFVIHNQYNIDH